MTMTIKTMGAKAIIHHLRKGIENGGISGHALALFLEGLTQHLESLEAESAHIRSFVTKWQQAYPLLSFPEPDLDKARRVLRENGMTLDAVNASMARHVLARIVEELDGVGKK